jgi:hypothetical protein
LEEVTLSGENAGHPAAEERSERGKGAEEEGDEEPVVRCHMRGFQYAARGGCRLIKGGATGIKKILTTGL